MAIFCSSLKSIANSADILQTTFQAYTAPAPMVDEDSTNKLKDNWMSHFNIVNLSIRCSFFPLSRVQTTVTEHDSESRLFIPMNKSDQILIAN